MNEMEGEQVNKPISVEDVLQSRMDVTLQDVVKEYFNRSIEKIQQMNPDYAAATRGMCWYLENIRPVRTIAPFFQPVTNIRTDYYISATATLAEPATGRSGEPENWIFDVGVNLDLTPGYQRIISYSCRLANEIPEEEKEDRGITSVLMNQFFRPILYPGDYKLFAQHILKYYFPEAKKREIPVDPDVVAERMGLPVFERKLYGDYKRQGLACYEDCSFEVESNDGMAVIEDFPARSIIINQNTVKNPVTRAITIMHECLHFSMDTYYFLLQRMGREKAMALAARAVGGYQYDSSEISWMEHQTEKMTAAVMMEEDSTIKVIEEQLEKHHGARTPNYIRTIISYLASRFHVSQSMARIRMIELGYQEAEGVFAYEDGERIPDYGCSTGWKPGVTYTVPRKAIEDLIQNSEFLETVGQGIYIFTEHHFCLDHPKYIGRNRAGEVRLTEYARNHIDECCLGFSAGGHFREYESLDSIAARNERESKDYLYPLTYIITAKPGTEEYVAQVKKFREYAYNWAELEQGLPEDFGDAVNYLIDHKGTTQLKIALEMGMNQSDISKMGNAACIPLSHVVALCLALKMNNSITEKMIAKSGCRVRNDDVTKLYKYMLEQPGGYTVEECNQMLKVLEYKPLVEKKKEQEKEKVKRKKRQVCCKG